MQHAFRIGEEHTPSGRKSHIFACPVEQAVAVFLLQLPDLRTHRGLRAKDFLPGAGEAAELGHFHECDKLVKVHGWAEL